MAKLPILIIGGAGKTGARVNALLQERGRAARDFSDYARRTAASGAWRA